MSENKVTLGSFSVEDYKDHLKNQFYNLDGLINFCFTCTDEGDLSQVALQKIFDAIYTLENAEKIPKLYDTAVYKEELAQRALSRLSNVSDDLHAVEYTYNVDLKSRRDQYDNLKENIINRFKSMKSDAEKLYSTIWEFKPYEKLMTPFASYSSLRMAITALRSACDSISSDNVDDILPSINKNDLLNYISSLYKYTSGRSGFEDFVKNLEDTGSVDYKKRLFLLATNEVPQCIGDRGDTKVLLTRENAVFSAEVINKFEIATPDTDKKNFVTNCFDYLESGEKESLLLKGGAIQESAGKWTYDGVTYSSASECLCSENTFQHFFDVAIKDKPFGDGVQGKSFEGIQRHSDLYKSLFDKLEAGGEDAFLDVKQSLIFSMEEISLSAYSRIFNYKKVLGKDIIEQTKILERYLYSNSGDSDRPNQDDDTAEFNKDASWDGLVRLKKEYETPKIIFEDLLDFMWKRCAWKWDDSKSPSENISNLGKTADDKLPKLIGDLKIELGEDQSVYNSFRSDADSAWRAYELATRGNPDDLLNLSLRYSTPDGTGKKITEIIRKNDGTYAISATKDASPEEKTATPEKALSHLAIHYYALAVCLEKAYVVMDIMTTQLEQIEELNKEIQVNNDYLRLANKWYSEYYEYCIVNGRGTATFSDVNAMPDLKHSLEDYVRLTCNYDKFSTSGLKYGVYNTSGDKGDGDFTNIDIEEQGNLTMISNAQEAIRMYGDKLSTQSQVATTRLQQYVQNFSACISICSTLAKAIAEYLRSIHANIRF